MIMMFKNIFKNVIILKFKFYNNCIQWFYRKVKIAFL